MPLRGKYPLADWILTKDDLSIGDIIAYFCDERGTEVEAEVIDLLPNDLSRVVVRQLNCVFSETLDFYNTICYKARKQPKNNHSCICGASFTSNPKYHYTWCNFYRKED